jgi:hopanoid biosynthesis associated protein HpnK
LVKRLIVNADDLGLTAGVNRGIAEAHERGIVTSATLMANGARFEEAVTLARSLPRLGVGCHIDLIQLSPTLPPRQLPTLVSGENFRHGLPRFAAAAMRGALSAAEITAEATAQLRRLQQAGVQVSHLDTHKHTHVFPPVLRALLQAARDCGVRAVRNPFEPARAASAMTSLASPALLKRQAAVWALRPMAGGFRRQVKAAGLATTDGTLGIAFTGRLDRRLICEMSRRMPQGTWELVTHPGYNDDGLARLSRLTASRESELEALTSSETRRCLEECGVQLISYRDL